MKQKSRNIATSEQSLVNLHETGKTGVKVDMSKLGDHKNVESSKFGDQKEIAKRYGLSEAMLERDRWDGKHGIPFYKVGRKVLYKLAEIEEWIEKRRQMSTSDVRQIV